MTQAGNEQRLVEDEEFEHEEDCYYCGRSPKRGESFVNVAVGIKHCGECDENGEISSD